MIVMTSESISQQKALLKAKLETEKSCASKSTKFASINAPQIFLDVRQKRGQIMEAFLITNALRIIWVCIKAIFISMMLYHFYDSILTYPSFPETGYLISKVFNWLYSFISSNWGKLMFVLIFCYSWASYRIVKTNSRRIEQLEVIAFSQISYLNYTPTTDISRVTSGEELIKIGILGWFLSWLGIDNPKDLPWSAKPERFGKEVTLQGDLTCNIKDDNE